MHSLQDTAAEQQVFFGKASTDVTQTALSNLKGLVPDNDVVGFMTALTSASQVRIFLSSKAS